MLHCKDSEHWEGAENDNCRLETLWLVSKHLYLLERFLCT